MAAAGAIWAFWGGIWFFKLVVAFVFFACSFVFVYCFGLLFNIFAGFVCADGFMMFVVANFECFVYKGFSGLSHVFLAAAAYFIWSVFFGLEILVYKL